MDPSSFSSAQWAIVVDDGNEFINIFTDQASGGHIPNPTLGGKHEYPTIAAGPGMHPSIPADNIGNRQYSFAWGHTSGIDYFANALDEMGNPINPNDCHVVNTNPCSLASDPYDLISMSHSCNSGFGTITAWNNNHEIMYKIRVDNDYKFRPGVADYNPKVLPMAASVYPNPANDFFMVKNAKIGTKVELVNALGQVQLEQNITSENAKIEVAQMAAGSYFVKFTDVQGKKQTKKLLLQ